LSALWILTRVRIAEVFRSRSTAFFMLALPVLLLAVMCGVFAHGHPFERQRVALVGARSFDDDTSARWRSALSSHRELHTLDVPREDHAIGMLRGRMVDAVFVVDPQTGPPRLIVGHDRDLLRRAISSLELSPLTTSVIDVPRWGFVHFLFPGILVYITLISGFFGMGYVMVHYRQTLLLKKLATTPLPRWVFIAAQIFARSTLTIVQIAVLIAIAAVAIDLPLSVRSSVWVVVLSLLGLFVFMGMGFVLACFIQTESSMVDAISVTTLPLVFFSEIFFPVDDLPAALSMSASVLPTTQLVRLLRVVLLEGETSFATLAPGAALLVVWGALTFGVSLVVFRWHE
jgi:ABC-type polysaccharide/polyol phosphate export permease